MQRKSSSSVQIFYPKYSKEEIVTSLRKRVKALHKKLPLKFAYLFGSYAEGNFTVVSDVDVLIVYRGKENEDAYAPTKKMIGLPRIEPHVYSEIQYLKMRETIDKMVKNGIILSSQ